MKSIYSRVVTTTKKQKKPLFILKRECAISEKSSRKRQSQKLSSIQIWKECHRFFCCFFTILYYRVEVENDNNNNNNNKIE